MICKRFSKTLYIIVIIVYLFIFFCFLPPSNSNKNISPTYSSEKNNSDIASTPGPVAQIEESPVPTIGLKAIESNEEFDATNLPIISAITEEGIYLYGIKEDMGVVLYFKGKGHYFEWSYLTPRFILPRMYYYDFDKDNSKEIAVVLYIGSGTSFSVEDLHIVEVSASKYLSEDAENKDFLEPNPEYFKDSCFSPDEYLSQLKKAVKINVHKKKGLYEADLKVSGNEYSFTPGVSEKEDEIENTYGIGDIVHFDYQENKLTAKFAIGFIHKLYATPEYFGDIFADVSYNKGKFKLENYRFEEYKDINN